MVLSLFSFYSALKGFYRICPHYVPIFLKTGTSTFTRASNENASQCPTKLLSNSPLITLLHMAGHC